MPFFLYSLVRTGRIVIYSAVVFPVLLLCSLTGSAVGIRTLRWYIQRLGGGFVKLGQILALRYDVLSVRSCRELQKLFDRMPPIPYSAVAHSVEQDLNCSLAEIFADFSESPIASASIAQVHRAKLRDGACVAVKVRRPHIDVIFRVDLGWLRLFSAFCDLFHVFSALSLSESVREVRERIDEELDFRREVRNLRQMARLLERDTCIKHKVPKVYERACGKRTITMEFVDGQSLLSLLDDVDDRDNNMVHCPQTQILARTAVAGLVLNSMLHQTLKHGIFHADPHPANIFVTPDGFLAWVDLAFIGWLDERSLNEQYRFLISIAHNELDRACESLLQSMAPLPRRDVSKFEDDAKRALREWMAASEDPIAAVEDKSVSRLLLQLFVSARKCRLRMPLRLLRLYRALMVADMVILKLDPQLNWVSAFRCFAETEAQRRLEQHVQSLTQPIRLINIVTTFLVAPEKLLRLLDFADTQLPKLCRDYEVGLSGLEKFMRASLTYVYRLVTLAILAMIFGRFVALRWIPDSQIARLTRMLLPYWGLTLFLGVLIYLAIRSLVRSLPPDLTM